MAEKFHFERVSEIFEVAITHAKVTGHTNLICADDMAARNVGILCGWNGSYRCDLWWTAPMHRAETFNHWPVDLKDRSAKGRRDYLAHKILGLEAPLTQLEASARYDAYKQGWSLGAINTHENHVLDAAGSPQILEAFRLGYEDGREAHRLAMKRMHDSLMSEPHPATMNPTGWAVILGDYLDST